VYPLAAIGAIAPNTGNPYNGMVSPMDDSSVPRGLVNNRGVQYGPRFGFAWDIFGDGKTAMRGGFGIFYNRQNLDAQILGNAFLPPIVLNPTISNGTFDTFLGSTGFASPQDVMGIDTIGKIPTVYNWSMTVQRNIGFGTVLDVAYEPALPRDTEATAEGLSRMLAQSRENDIRRATTTQGPHRDDLALAIGGIDARLFASQGQQRTAALSLKLAELKIMAEQTGETPLLLLDDVLSELDQRRRRMLLAHIDGVQTFLTCVDGERPSLPEGAAPRVYRVKEGRIAAE
jgi:hypothetical protein